MLPVFTRFGNIVPLAQIAEIRADEGPVAIEHDEQKRKVSVTANVTGRDLGSAAKDVEKVMSSLVTQGVFPSGYSYKIGGQYEDMKSSMFQLIIALIAAILLVYMVMAAQFESFKFPFVIMFTVPLAMIGVVLGLLVMGHTISVVSFLVSLSLRVSL
jgi:HAE1 family hydrophobic/amphiphilic exporter-1